MQKKRCERRGKMFPTEFTEKKKTAERTENRLYRK